MRVEYVTSRQEPRGLELLASFAIDECRRQEVIFVHGTEQHQAYDVGKVEQIPTIRGQEEQKEFVIVLPDALIQPNAVVIKGWHTHAAQAAMLRACWLAHFARLTIGALGKYNLIVFVACLVARDIVLCDGPRLLSVSQEPRVVAEKNTNVGLCFAIRRRLDQKGRQQWLPEKHPGDEGCIDDNEIGNLQNGVALIDNVVVSLREAREDAVPTHGFADVCSSLGYREGKKARALAI